MSPGIADLMLPEHARAPVRVAGGPELAGGRVRSWFRVWVGGGWPSGCRRDSAVRLFLEVPAGYAAAGRPGGAAVPDMCSAWPVVARLACACLRATPLTTMAKPISLINMFRAVSARPRGPPTQMPTHAHRRSECGQHRRDRRCRPHGWWTTASVRWWFEGRGISRWELCQALCVRSAL